MRTHSIALAHALGATAHVLEKLDRTERLVVELARRGGVDEEAAILFGVAVHEAAVNALLHGRDRRGCHTRVDVRTAPRRLIVTVRDQGCGFDPGRVADPLQPQNLARDSGRGLFYMRRFCDRVRFSFPRAGGSVVRLEKVLPNPVPARKPL